jgi:hypothetical protein
VFPFYNILLHIYKSIKFSVYSTKASLIDAKSPISTMKRTIRILFNLVRKADLPQALYKLCRRKTGNLVEITPSGGTKAITYIGEKLVYVKIGIVFHGFHYISDTMVRDVFHKRLSRITAERFAHIRTVGA